MRRVSLLLLFVSPALSCIGGGMGGGGGCCPPSRPMCGAPMCTASSQSHFLNRMAKLFAFKLTNNCVEMDRQIGLIGLIGLRMG
ncbi:hypothetical protein WR25_13778 [Diploscapter pachys]|uniref:Secreted protein n=1 Tax=Diploscapter pachys TaxID=2018661 RepID=A0A2A2JHN4_9BILA|nr:hypothetical protein WR25_13778 [Diploscapter pachys]